MFLNYIIVNPQWKGVLTLWMSTSTCRLFVWSKEVFPLKYGLYWSVQDFWILGMDSGKINEKNVQSIDDKIYYNLK